MFRWLFNKEICCFSLLGIAVKSLGSLKAFFLRPLFIHFKWRGRSENKMKTSPVGVLSTGYRAYFIVISALKPHSFHHLRGKLNYQLNSNGTKQLSGDFLLLFGDSFTIKSIFPLQSTQEKPRRVSSRRHRVADIWSSSHEVQQIPTKLLVCPASPSGLPKPGPSPVKHPSLQEQIQAVGSCEPSSSVSMLSFVRRPPDSAAFWLTRERQTSTKTLTEYICC